MVLLVSHSPLILCANVCSSPNVNLILIFNLLKQSPEKGEVFGPLRGISDRMVKGCKEVKVNPDYFSNLTADGGSNAIGYLVKNKVATCSTHEFDLNFHVC